MTQSQNQIGLRFNLIRPTHSPSAATRMWCVQWFLEVNASQESDKGTTTHRLKSSSMTYVTMRTASIIHVTTTHNKNIFFISYKREGTISQYSKALHRARSRKIPTPNFLRWSDNTFIGTQTQPKPTKKINSMRPPVTVQTTTFSSPSYSYSSSSSSSSASDRRLNTLARHLVQIDCENQQNMSASPTASHGDSVFAHLVRAPEDPILGVRNFLFLFPFLFSLC